MFKFYAIAVVAVLSTTLVGADVPVDKVLAIWNETISSVVNDERNISSIPVALVERNDSLVWEPLPLNDNSTATNDSTTIRERRSVPVDKMMEWAEEVLDAWNETISTMVNDTTNTSSIPVALVQRNDSLLWEPVSDNSTTDAPHQRDRRSVPTSTIVSTRFPHVTLTKRTRGSRTPISLPTLATVSTLLHHSTRTLPTLSTRSRPTLHYLSTASATSQRVAPWETRSTRFSRASRSTTLHGASDLTSPSSPMVNDASTHRFSTSSSALLNDLTATSHHTKMTRTRPTIKTTTRWIDI